MKRKQKLDREKAYWVQQSGAKAQASLAWWDRKRGQTFWHMEGFYTLVGPVAGLGLPKTPPFPVVPGLGH